MPNISDLITEIGGSASTSYVTLAEFTNYRDLNKLNADAFDSATPDDKIRSLIMAARRLDRENWQGSKVSSTQRLAWPRYEVPKRDSTISGIPNRNPVYYTTGLIGEYYPGTEIPQIIKDAQCELALAMLDGFDESEGRKIARFSADEITIDYAPTNKEGSLPTAVSQLLSGLIRSGRLLRA